MPRFAANLSTLFTERPFLDRFGAAAACGFTAVECQFPYEAPADGIAGELRRLGLAMALFNLPPGDWLAGERGIAIFPDRREEFRDGLERALAYATALGCTRLHCLAGILPEALDPTEAEATYLANLRLAAEEAQRRGMKILIEPINQHDMPAYFLRSMDHAADIASKVGHRNIFLQYDLYHQSRMGGALVETFARHRTRIAHLQIAGSPGRDEPDRGEIDYPAVLGAITRLGYAGFVGCEYLPAGRTEDGLGWLAAYDLAWLEEPAHA